MSENFEIFPWTQQTQKILHNKTGCHFAKYLVFGSQNDSLQLRPRRCFLTGTLVSCASYSWLVRTQLQYGRKTDDEKTKFHIPLCADVPFKVISTIASLLKAPSRNIPHSTIII